MSLIHTINFEEFKKYANNKSIIDEKISYLEPNGIAICNKIHEIALKILNSNDELNIVEDGIQEITNTINKLYPTPNCYPSCTDIFNPKCIHCNVCRPNCDKYNHKCYKCNSSILTFNNSERLTYNKNKIKELLMYFLTGNNEISGKNTLSLIKIHLSVLPSLVI